MIGCIAQRIDTAHLVNASILARSRLEHTELMVGTFFVRCTARLSWFDDTFADRCDSVAVLNWTDASASFIVNETALQCAHTATGLVNFVAFLDAARYTFAVNIDGRAWSTDAVSVDVSDIASI